MKGTRVNKILFLFLFLVAAMLVGARYFIQSEFLGKYISHHVHELVQNKIGADVEFTNIEIGFFPPATYLKSVQFKMSLPGNNWIDVRAGELGVNFSIVDVFKKELSINEVTLREAEVYVKAEESEANSEKKLNLKLDYIFTELREGLIGNLPITIRGLVIENTLLYLNDATVSIDNFSLMNLRKNIQVSGHLKSIKSGKTHIDKYLKRDSIVFDLELTEKKLRFVNVEITDKLNRLRAFGEIQDNLENGKIDLNVEFSGGVEDLIQEALGKEIGVGGYVDLKVELSNTLEKPVAKFKIEGKRIITPYLQADDLMASAIFDDKKVIVQKVWAKRADGDVTNRAPLIINTEDIDNLFLPLKLNNVFTNDALFAVPTLSGLKGNLTGEVDISISKDKLLFQVFNKSYLKNPRYFGNEKEPPIVAPKDIEFSNSSVVVDLIQDTVFLNLNGVSGKSTQLGINGKIAGNKIDLTLEKAPFDFDDFGKIVDFPIIGKGSVGLQIIGTDDDVEFIADLDLSDFSILGFQSKKISGLVDFNLNKLFMKLNNVLFDFDSTLGTGEGYINFKTSAISLGFDFQKTSYKDIQYIVGPFFKENEIFLPESIRSNVNAKIYLSNKLSDLIVNGEIQAFDMDIYGETFEKGSAKIKISEKEIFIDSIEVNKGQGSVAGSIHLYEGDIDDVIIQANGYRLRDIDLYRLSGIGLDGQIDGKIELRKLFGELVAKGNLKLKNSNINNERVDDSQLFFKLNEGMLSFNGNFLGESMNAQGEMSLNDKVNSNVSLKYDFKNLKELFGIVSEHNINDQSLNGRVRGELNSEFRMRNFEELNLNFKLNELSLKRGSSSIKINRPYELKMLKGQVEETVIRISQNEKSIVTKFNGSLKSGLRIEQNLNLDAEWIELLTPKIHKVSGKLTGRGVIVATMKKIENFYEVQLKEGALRIANVPNSFTDLEGRVVIDGVKILVENIKSNYGGGKISADGFVNIEIPFPEVLINYKIQDSYVPFLKKSGALIAAEGSLSGSKLPYVIDGRVNVKGGSFKDEFSEFTKSEIIPSSVYQFIPEKRNIDNKNILDLNLQVGVSSPIYIENSLSELQFSGNARISGDIGKPLVDGDLIFIQALSKFKFKGHEFILREGRVNFDSKDQAIAPDLFFVASSQVNQYDIKLEVSGKTNDLNIALTSEPFLVQEDILSLLTLGVTSDISQGLQSRERESVTTLGLGTLLVDQLKINEGLNSSLGLRLSVLPEFGENEQTLLQGKSGVSDGEVSRYKSATKVKIQKNISEKVDLSLSSTIGGSLEQKQEMNLNFSINKNLSVEGVYELKSSSEETIDTPDSVGADIKYKWSF